jgi:deazaflavin-dependent oxidoreductase (nitroreductase family)
MPGRPGAGLRRLLQLPAWLYRRNCGWLLGKRFLLLIHIGRRTRLTRSTVLEVMEYRETTGEAVVASGWGRHAEWLRNIDATPNFEIVLGTRRFAAAHRVLGVDEAAEVLAGYERRNRLAGPIIRLVLGRLLGWRYDGSDTARRRAAAQLPLIAFRPLR